MGGECEMKIEYIGHGDEKINYKYIGLIPGVMVIVLKI